MTLYRKVPSSLDAKAMIGINGPKLCETDERIALAIEILYSKSHV